MFKFTAACLLLIVTAAFGAEPRVSDLWVIGLATSDCLRSNDAAIKPGMPVTLIVADHSLRIQASIGPRVADCADASDSTKAGYRLTTLNQFDFAVAVIGEVPASLQAHSCASSQGINVFLTSESQAKALWRGYYNLGHHIESDCMAKDLVQMQAQAR